MLAAISLVAALVQNPAADHAQGQLIECLSTVVRDGLRQRLSADAFRPVFDSSCQVEAARLREIVFQQSMEDSLRIHEGHWPSDVEDQARTNAGRDADRSVSGARQIAYRRFESFSRPYGRR